MISEDGDEIRIIWSVHDVLFVCPQLTYAQAREVLHEAHDRHDAEYGIAWATFEMYADIMFPRTMG